LDLNVKLDFDLGAGRWHSNFQYSHVFDLYYTDAVERSPNQIGLPGYPEARATLSNDYSIGDFSFSWNTHYIADQYMEYDWDTEVGSGHLPTWVTHDLQASYHAPWDGKLTIGAQNAFDKQPPIGGPFWRDYNFDLYNGWGRTWYVQYTQTFD
jgi:iron complex outermembrane receptor protein